MSEGVNKVILVGNLGGDPEVKYNPQGKAMAAFPVATSERWTDKQTGQKQERTEWHRVVLFDRIAEVAGEYLRKGSKVYIEGSLRTRKWQDSQGQDRYTTQVIGKDMQMLDSRGSTEGAQGGSYGDTQARAPAPTPPPRPAPAPAPPPSAPAPATQGPPSFDDDIPF